METCYVDKETRSIADLVQPGELTPWWTVTRINVPRAARGKGCGSALLNRITDDADRDGATLALEPRPSDDGLQFEELVAWYKRHGFKFSTWLVGYMVRRPR